MRSVAVLLSIAMSLPLANAQEVSSAEPIDVKSQEFKVTSIIYSSYVGQALVGVHKENANRVYGNFAECKAPRGSLLSEVTIADLSNCTIRNDKWFEVNEQNQAVFAGALQRELEDNYQRQYSNQLWDDSSVTVFMYPLLGVVITGYTAFGGYQAYKLFKSGARIRGAAAMALVGGFGVLTGFWDYASARHFWHVNFSKAPSIESQVLASYKKLLVDNPETQKIDMTKVNWAFTYNSVVKKSVYRAIEDVLSL